MIALRAACGFLAGTLLLAPHTVFGQDKYPAKFIRVVTATPGSNHDWGARIVAQELTPRIGQRVIVENRGSIAVEYVAREAPPDGYTLLFYGAYAWLQPLLAKVSWDPVEDLAPITLAISSPNVLVVHPSLPVKSVRELIALAKARPGALNYSAGGGGSTPHIAAELFNYMANVKIVRVHYKGSGPSMLGLFVGEVQLMFAALGPIMPHAKSGKVRALAVTTPKRSPLAPDLPAVGEALPGYSFGGGHRFFRAEENARVHHQTAQPRDTTGAQSNESADGFQFRRGNRRQFSRGVCRVHQVGHEPDERSDQEWLVQQLAGGHTRIKHQGRQMQIQNQFEIPVPPAAAWALLMDVPRTAACFPGAELTATIDADHHKGRVTVKLGPVTMLFAGDLKIEDRDDAQHRATVKANWTETKGRGNAATVTRFALQEYAGGTRVDVDSDVQLAGQVAQYGRGAGMISAVSAQLITAFADNLRVRIQASAPRDTLEARPLPAAPTELSVFQLLWKAAVNWFKRLWVAK